MCIITDERLLPLPTGCVLLSDNTVSQVWRAPEGAGIYKRSLPFLIENELGMLQAMNPSGYTPFAALYDPYTLWMHDLGPGQTGLPAGSLQAHLAPILLALEQAGITHGDLTPPNVIISRGHPWLLDFAESRYKSDPRRPKRPETDHYHLSRTLRYYEVNTP